MRKVETKIEGTSGRAVQELLSIARMSLEDEEYGASFSQFLNILKKDPNSADAKFGLGDAYFGLADYENAESTYRLGLLLYHRFWIQKIIKKENEWKSPVNITTPSNKTSWF